MALASSAPSTGARVFAGTGAVLFALALGYLLYSYWMLFGPVPGPVHWSAVAIDIVLFTAFALHHSVFARGPVRAWVARVAPARLERSVYVWVASILLMVVCAAWQPVAGVTWAVGPPGAWLVALLPIAGFWLTLRGAAVIDPLELAGLRQPTAPGATTEPIEFKTIGPYGRIRHPIYAGWFLIVFGVPVMSHTRLVFALVSSLYLLVAIPLEERTLRATTAGAYDRYIQRVRWKLMPGVF